MSATTDLQKALRQIIKAKPGVKAVENTQHYKPENVFA